MPKEARDSDAPTEVDSHARANTGEVTLVVLPSDRFADEGQIAHGGASAVHRIFDRTLLRHSAMKLLAMGLQPFPEERQRFVHEAQITAQLIHPNVVPIYELGLTSTGGPYFTMKLVEGDTMETLLAERNGQVRQLGWVAAFLEILVKVCDAIGFAHSRGVIHRDLKPSNIMVGSFGQVYVMDWGIAKLMSSCSDVTISSDRDGPSERQGDFVGTPSYMSPEQAWGDHRATDERSDIYQLGATLYHVLTGHVPHESNARMSAIESARLGACKPPEELPTTAKLPRSLLRIAMRAMVRDPRERYQTVSAMKEDLVAQLRGGADLPRRTFAPGELIMREGDPGEAAYMIVQGTCRAFKLRDGKEIELRRMGPGEVFGETAILSAAPRTASVQALDELTVRVVTPDELEEGVGLNTWVGAFVRTLAERFRELDERLTPAEHPTPDRAR
jgi:serine/threonine-protein kinase